MVDTAEAEAICDFLDGMESMGISYGGLGCQNGRDSGQGLLLDYQSSGVS
jgi:hypothetical protein